MAAISFGHVSMCWNADNVQPFAFDNTMLVKKDHPLDHLMAWTAMVARGAPGGRLKALVINCHGYYSDDSTGTMDSAGGIPKTSGGFGLDIGSGGGLDNWDRTGTLDSAGGIPTKSGPKIATGINWKNANLFRALNRLINEIYVYACGAANTPIYEYVNTNMCQIIADSSNAIVIASQSLQPDVIGPGLNRAPEMVGKVIRFIPRYK